MSGPSFEAPRRALPVLAPPARAPVERLPPRSVRLSVTDRCDFACVYCRPSRQDGYVDGRLDLDDWSTLVEGLRRAGVRRVRLTGGEPLVHPRIVEIVARLARLGFEDLALTTNGSQLVRLARPLRDAGLHRLNLSLDTLDEDRFRAITRGGELAPVLDGLERAAAIGFAPIKLNTVVLRGVNDDEIERLTRFAWDRRFVPRFLEVMPIAEGRPLARTHLVTAAELRARLAPFVVAAPPTVEPDRGPATYLRAAHDPALRVGFISGTSDTYCASCDRLRVSSTGDLRPCLATDDGVPAADAVAARDPAAVADRVDAAWARKPDGRVFRGCNEDTAAHVSMRAIGG